MGGEPLGLVIGFLVMGGRGLGRRGLDRSRPEQCRRERSGAGRGRHLKKGPPAEACILGVCHGVLLRARCLGGGVFNVWLSTFAKIQVIRKGRRGSTWGLAP